MSGRLSGKIAIVTGAGSRGSGLGNGKATTMLFAREGAKVLCALDILRNNVGIESRKDLLEVIGFVRSIAVQLGPKSIRVNAIAPGPVWTPMVEDLGPDARERRRRASPLGTEGTGLDVGWGAVYLASDEARWVTGQTLISR